MKKILWIVILQLAAVPAFSQSKSIIYSIANRNGERRDMLFTGYISDILYLAKDGKSFKEAHHLKFSANSQINLDSLDMKAVPFRKAFPKDYFNNGAATLTLDTQPNEDGSIWYEQVLVVEDSKGGIKPFAALKVVFEGTDATKERISPKIKDIVFTTTPGALKKYVPVIQQLKQARKIKTPKVVDINDAPPPPIRSL